MGSTAGDQATQLSDTALEACDYPPRSVAKTMHRQGTPGSAAQMVGDGASTPSQASSDLQMKNLRSLLQWKIMMNNRHIPPWWSEDVDEPLTN